MIQSQSFEDVFNRFKPERSLLKKLPIEIKLCIKIITLGKK